MGNLSNKLSVNTKNRSQAPEVMDDFSMEGEILRDALDKIAGINRFLGGNSVTINGLEILLSTLGEEASSRTIRILDVGCGNGDMLRVLAAYGLKKGLVFELTGIDANAFTAGYADQLSARYPNIKLLCGDIFEEIKQAQTYDVILCTLTLHHFKDLEIVELMAAFENRATLGVVVNDLQRSALAYRLFQLICLVFGLNSMSRDDGLVSILRGFKKEDLEKYTAQLKVNKYLIRWKWAFRYQWIIFSNNAKNNEQIKPL